MVFRCFDSNSTPSANFYNRYKWKMHYVHHPSNCATEEEEKKKMHWWYDSLYFCFHINLNFIIWPFKFILFWKCFRFHFISFFSPQWLWKSSISFQFLFLLYTPALSYVSNALRIAWSENEKKYTFHSNRCIHKNLSFLFILQNRKLFESEEKKTLEDTI